MTTLKRRLDWVNLTTYAILLLIALFCLIPFVWLFTASLDARASLYLQPVEFSLNNFVRIFSEADTARLIANSLIYSIGATVVAVLSCTLGGYTLSRLEFPGRRVLMYSVLLSRVIPATATIVPLYIIFLRLQMVDTYHGLILLMAANQVPLLLWMMKGFFDTVPLSLEEAAWIDGAGRLRSVFSVVFPLAGPGAAAAALFAFTGAWGEFLAPLILISSPDKLPISVGLFRSYVAYGIIDWGKLTAMSIVYMIPSVVFFLLARRYLIQTTAAGALSGE